MSKEPDKDVVESPDSQRIRKRRKSALRIPSDNVPRNTDGVPASTADDPSMGTEASDGEVMAPIEDDPNVAVPLNYLTRPADDERPAPRTPLAASSPVSRSISARPTGPAASSNNDDLELRPTEQMPAVTEDMLRALTSEDNAGGQNDGDVVLDDRRTRQIPAIRLEDLGLSFDNNPALKLGDSIDISLDDDDDADDETGGDDAFIAEDGGADARDMPESEHSVIRASTVALSDDDLEELIEQPEDRAARAASIQRITGRRSNALSSVVPITEEIPAMEDPDEDGADQSGDAAVSVHGLGDLDSGEGAARRRPAVHPPEPGVPAAVAALEFAGMESPHDTPLELGDAGDSAELISDDLVEEVDDSDVEVEPEERRPSPPPAPPSAIPQKKPPPSPKVSTPAKPATEAQQKRRKGKPWFEDIFDEDYLRTLPFLMPQATQSEAAFVASALEVEPGSQLLDVGCGYGRHAMELAARGYQVVALDLSLPLLLRGADEAQRRGLNINFVHGDMRELSFEDQFDGAYCLFSTFGYFDDETNKKTMQGISRALKPGARLVIEVLNRDYLIADLPARVWWEGDGCVVLEEVDFNYFASRIASNRSVVFDDGRQLEQEISMRAYSLHEFGKVLHAAGLRVLEISGSTATRGRFFGNKSREIIVVAEKRVLKEPGACRSGTSDDTSL